MKRLIIITRKIADFLEVVSQICLMGVVSMVVLQIMARSFALPIAGWTDEVLQFFLAYFIYFGAAFMVERMSHIQIDIIPVFFRGKFGKFWDILIQLLIILPSIGLIYGGYLWISGIATFTPFLQVGYRYFYASLPICGALIVFFALMNIVKICNTEYDSDQKDVKTENNV